MSWYKLSQLTCGLTLNRSFYNATCYKYLWSWCILLNFAFKNHMLLPTDIIIMKYNFISFIQLNIFFHIFIGYHMGDELISVISQVTWWYHKRVSIGNELYQRSRVIKLVFKLHQYDDLCIMTIFEENKFELYKNFGKFEGFFNFQNFWKI